MNPNTKGTTTTTTTATTTPAYRFAAGQDAQKDGRHFGGDIFVEPRSSHGVDNCAAKAMQDLAQN